MVVALDFTKAFDSVRWSLIIKTLETFNFGVEFVNYVRLLFQNVESRIINSGTTSEAFHPGCGIRQGCCASSFLFNLVVELLAALIRKNARIRGITFG